MMAKIVDLELINTNKGLFIIHMHAGDDPRYCYAWKREGPRSWRQRHMQGYEARCPKCRKEMPNAVALEEFYEDRIKDGLNSLQYIEARNDAGGALLSFL